MMVALSLLLARVPLAACTFWNGTITRVDGFLMRMILLTLSCAPGLNAFREACQKFALNQAPQAQKVS
jgi:hypothetical protein